MAYPTLVGQAEATSSGSNYSITASGTSSSGQAGDLILLYAYAASGYYGLRLWSSSYGGSATYNNWTENFYTANWGSGNRSHCGGFAIASGTAGVPWQVTVNDANWYTHHIAVKTLRIRGQASGTAFSDFGIEAPSMYNSRNGGAFTANTPAWGSNTESLWFELQGSGSPSATGITYFGGSALTAAGGVSAQAAVDGEYMNNGLTSAITFSYGSGEWKCFWPLAIKGPTVMSGTASTSMLLSTSGIAGEAKAVGGGWGTVMI
ncbi:MAG: hypothetical protein HN348_34055 [Proteobacteria bacterium]|jgi:hypothetical protein|nr:hypothetical protein [Pseudomonadota bacterium]